MPEAENVSDADAIVERQRALEKTAGEALPDVLEAFERGCDDGRRRSRPFRFPDSPPLRDLALSYANGFALAKSGNG